MRVDQVSASFGNKPATTAVGILLNTAVVLVYYKWARTHMAALGTYSFPRVVQPQDKHIDLGLGKEISNQPGDEGELETGKVERASAERSGVRLQGSKMSYNANFSEQLIHNTTKRCEPDLRTHHWALPRLAHGQQHYCYLRRQQAAPRGAVCDIKIGTARACDF